MIEDVNWDDLVMSCYYQVSKEEFMKIAPKVPYIHESDDDFLRDLAIVPCPTEDIKI